MVEMRMEFSHFTRDQAGWNQLTISPQGEVGRDLKRRGHTLAALARITVEKRTGRLARSIETRYHAVPNPWITVGSNLSYAYDVHEGTRPHIIRAENRETLRFKIRGRIVYVEQVVHPGTRAKKYLTRHLRRVVND